VFYAAYILVFRAAAKADAPPSAPLLDATIGMLAGALLSIPFDRHFTWTPGAAAMGWLALLGLVCQVVGWMFLTAAMPRLPALETSILLLGQPVFAIVWGVLIFDERLSPLQWVGSALVLVGVATLTAHASPAPPPPRAGRFRRRRSYSPAT
jgi:drug/metabolite transporter (DMT)-like permease